MYIFEDFISESTVRSIFFADIPSLKRLFDVLSVFHGSAVHLEAAAFGETKICLQLNSFILNNLANGKNKTLWLVRLCTYSNSIRKKIYVEENAKKEKR